MKEKHIFAVIDDSMQNDIKQNIRVQQHKSMRYFINVSNECIETNSSVVMSMLLAKGALLSIGEGAFGFPVGWIGPGIKAKTIENAVNQGMVAQVKADEMQMFVCAVSGRPIEKEELDEAIEGARKCHEQEGLG